MAVGENRHALALRLVRSVADAAGARRALRPQVYRQRHVRALRLGAERMAPVIGRLLARIGCLWRGHDDIYRFEPKLVTLCCQRCGRESGGWSLADLRPPIRSRD
jgi:hypothetical protein